MIPHQPLPESSRQIVSRRSFLRGFAVGGAGLAAVALVGCGGDDDDEVAATPDTTATATATATPTQATETATAAPTEAAVVAVRLVVPNDHNLQWMNYWVAVGAGLFEDEGLEIETVFPSSAGATPNFLIMGMADVAVLAHPMYLTLIGDEEPVVIFANLLANDPINLVVHEDVAAARGVSADMPLAERLEALRGIRVGVAPGPPSRLRVLFESVGLDADTDIEMVITPPERQNAAFGAGEVDALYTHTPFLEEALDEQGGVMIVNQSAGEVPELANLMHHAMATTRDYAEANGDTLVAIARALYRAQQLIHSDLDATEEALIKSGVQELNLDLLGTIVAIYDPAIPQTPEVSTEAALRELALFPAILTPPDLSGIDLTEYVQPRFAQQAIEG